MLNFRDLRKLAYFVAVAEELHFGRAATRLGIAQPPLSMQIQELEASLKTKLFERNRRAVALTPAGEILLAEARRVLRDVENLDAIMHGLKSQTSRVLRIGCVTSAMFGPLPALLERFRKASERIDIVLREMNTPEIVDAVGRGHLDIGLARLGRVGEGYVIVPLAADRLMIAVPRKHSFASRRAISLSALAGEPVVIVARKANPDYYDRIIAACMRSGFSPCIQCEASSLVAQIGYVACGFGLAIVPSTAQIAHQAVAFVEIDECLEINETALICRNNEASHVLLEQLNLLPPAYRRAGPLTAGERPSREPARA